MRNLIHSIFILVLMHSSNPWGFGQCTTCIEPVGEIPATQLILCENFESFANQSDFPLNNSKWVLWPGTKDLAKITTPTIPNSSKALFVKRVGNADPDVLLKLGNKTKGRYRLSWQMYIAKGKTARYNFQHEENDHWAFEVTFNANGLGSLGLFGENVTNFPVLIGSWNKIMHIIDLNEDKIELWINDEFVDSWKFSLGFERNLQNKVIRSNNGKLSAVNFYAVDGSEFYVDNICMWGSSTSVGFPIRRSICIKNGASYLNSFIASVSGLYTKNETINGQCPSICNFHGINIENSKISESNKLFDTNLFPPLINVDSNDVLPKQFTNLDCSSQYFPNTTQSKIRGKIYTITPIKNPAIYVSLNVDSVFFDAIEVLVLKCSPGNVLNENQCIKPNLKMKSALHNIIGYEFPAEINSSYIVVVIANTELSFSLVIRDNLNIFDCTSCPCFNVNIEELKKIPISLKDQKVNEPSMLTESFGFQDGEFLGGERYFSFIVEKSANVNIVTSSKNMGFSTYLLGSSCSTDIYGYSFTAKNGGSSSINKYLEAGFYHLIIDQLNPNPSVTFNLSISELEQIPDPKLEDNSCPVQNNSFHTVTIRANPLLLDGNSLNINDRIYLSNEFTSTYREQVGYNWNGNEIQFKLYADNLTDKGKCGFVLNETIQFTVKKGDKFFKVRPNYQPQNGLDVNAQDKFTVGGKSLINGFYSELDVSNLSVGSIPNLTANSKNFTIELNCNTNWRIHRKNQQSISWLTYVPESGTGVSDVNFSINSNPYAQNREDTLYLTNEEGFQKQIIIAQAGCLGPSVNAGIDQSFCPNKNTILTATGTGVISWITPSSTVSKPQLPISVDQTRTYTAYATLNGCTAIDQVNIKVNPNPTVVKESINPFTGPFGHIQVKVSGGTPNYKFQWFRNDTLISTQEDLTGLKSGIHKLIVTDANGCTATFGPQAVIVTNAIDITLEKNIRISPNPTDGLLNLEFQLEQNTPLEINVLDALGRRSWQQERQVFYRKNLIIDLSAHAPGMYWIQFKTDAGAFFKKVIRQ